MKKYIAVAVIIFYKGWPVVYSAPVPTEGTLRYELSYGSQKVGEATLRITAITKRGNTVYLKEATADIKAKMLGLSLFSLNTEEKALSGKNGVYEYRSEYVLNGEKNVVSGRLRGDSFHFKITMKGKKYRKRIECKDYDLTSMDGLEEKLVSKGEKKELRVLNLDNLKIEVTTVEWVGNEELLLGGENTKCKVVAFSSAQGNGKYWITMDGRGMIVKEKGKGRREGNYSMVLSDYKSKKEEL